MHKLNNKEKELQDEPNNKEEELQDDFWIRITALILFILQLVSPWAFAYFYFDTETNPNWKGESDLNWFGYMLWILWGLYTCFAIYGISVF